MTPLGTLEFSWPEALIALPVCMLLAFLIERANARRAAKALDRSALISVTVVGLVALTFSRPALVGAHSKLAVVIVADRSASVDAEDLETILSEAGLPRDDVAAISFGDDRGSPLAAALTLATRALPGGGRVVLISDGQSTTGDPVSAAAAARAAGVLVDVVPVRSSSPLDAGVLHVEVPATWRVGDEVPVDVTIAATAPLSGDVGLEANGEPAGSAPLALDQGRTSLRMTHRAESIGDVRYRAVLQLEGDSIPENNVGYATTQVFGPPRVLMVGDGPGVVGLSDTLLLQGFATTTVAPERLPVRLSALGEFDAMVLVDVAASSMGLDQLSAVEAFVADMGGGVLLTAGRQSFLPGGWEHTPLERMAPVDLEPPARGQRDAVSLLLMVDQSASMGGEVEGRITKLDLAREAAILATEVLNPGDRVGVIAYDDEARWLVTPSEVGAGRDLAEVEEAIGRVKAGGGTRILRALELGLPELAKVDVVTRHAVLLSDGRDFNPDRARYDSVVRSAREAGVTLSTIAIGFDADQGLLMRLAQRGRGRYHRAEDPSDLPRLAVQESEIVRARVEQRGEFRAIVDGGVRHPVLSGLDPAALPSLTGYLAVSRRDRAEVALAAPNADPLLASWNYGLGRVAAWMSDVGEDWTLGWPTSREAQRFWARVVRYLARSPEAGPPGVTVEDAGGEVRLMVDARDGSGRTVDLAEVTAVITGDGSSGAAVLGIPQVAPGRYELTVPSAYPGAYPAAVEVARGDLTQSVPTGWSVSYAPELAPPGDGAKTLAAVAAAGGGRLLEGSMQLPQVGQTARRELWPWLLAASSAIWLLQVARRNAVGSTVRRTASQGEPPNSRLSGRDT